MIRNDRWVVALCVGILLAPHRISAQEEEQEIVAEAQDDRLETTAAQEEPDAPAGSEEPEAPSVHISMEFKEASLKDVLRLFSQQTGINVIASNEVKDQPITLYLEHVTALDALDQILNASGLIYERPAGSDIYIVKPAPEKTAKAAVRETRVYRLRFARVSSSRLAKAVEAFGSITPFESKSVTVSAARAICSIWTSLIPGVCSPMNSPIICPSVS